MQFDISKACHGWCGYISCEPIGQNSQPRPTEFWNIFQRIEEMTKMAWTSLVCFGMLAGLLPSLSMAQNDGLYATNGSHIFLMKNVLGNMMPVIVYQQEDARIVGLAIDIEDNVIFWSDISPGYTSIYKASLNNGQLLLNVKKIIQSDVVEVNGLAVDWESKNLYWTDAKKKTIEVSNYEGQHRRVLSVTGLSSPRGIYCDPVSGFLFWNDQGQKVIGQSRPDGSQQKIIHSDNVHLPNQMVVYRSILYWVDSLDKEIWRSELDGSKRENLGSVSSLTLDSNVFGIALDPNGQMYVSAWERGAVIALNAREGDDFEMAPVLPYSLGSAMFSLAFYGKSNLQPAASNPCAPARGADGCSHLCLPTGPQTARCSCPSYGGLVISSDGKNCVAPRQVLVYALGHQGSVEYIDADNPGQLDRYLVGRSMRPVAVTYDPLNQVVYWSDVHERRIHRAKLDGSEHSIVLDMTNGVGIVDGLAVDYINRKLYYSNLGVVGTGAATYDWHQIEAVDLDTKSVRVVVTKVEKPRALFVDSAAGHLYFTDWGTAAKVVRTNLDGGDPVTLKTGFDNPNGITVNNGEIFVVDSHYKTRQEGNPRYPFDPQNGTISAMDTRGENWRQWNSLKLQTPFGITSKPRLQQFYVSDWETRSIVTLTLTKTGWMTPQPVVENVDMPMGVVFSVASLAKTVTSPCDIHTLSCDDMCFVGGGVQPKSMCACASYGANVLENDLYSCQVPKEFLMFVDMNRIKLIGYDSDDRSLYNAVSGKSNVSNFAAMAYDSAQQAVYYSEVGQQMRRGIYFSKMDGSQTKRIFTGNSIIEGLVLDRTGGSLYWSDMLAGQIVSMASSGDMDTYKVVVNSLSHPRAVQLDNTNGYIYWSEWGDRPRIARKRLAGSEQPETVVSVGLKQPNGLALDVKQSKMYIGDGYYKKIMTCDLQGMGCSELTAVSGKAEHIYSVAVYNQMLYYSDWKQGSVTQVDLDTGRITQVAQDLMRPTNIVLQYQGGVRACPSNNPCSYRCNATLHDYFCWCPPGETLSVDGTTCIKDKILEVADPSQCGSTCGQNEICAKQLGGSTVQHSCVCKPGYYMRTLGADSSCKACEVNKYKPHAGNDEKCEFCPQVGVITPEGSTDCECRGGEFWNSQSKTCGENKGGICPSAVSARFKCQRACNSDGDCLGAQKCCHLQAQCGNKQCIDPNLDSTQCAHGSKVYRAGESFQMDACTHCKCSTMRGSPYAQMECVVRKCPVLVCTTDQQVLPSGSCCPVCTPNPTPPGVVPNITIENCPEGQVVNLTLEKNAHWARHGFYIQPYDRTGMDRSINITKIPSGGYYEWTGQTVAVRWTAAALRPSGEWDVAVCSYKVKVLDNEPPIMKCPGDIQVFTSNKSSPVTWLHPTASDNVGVMGDPRQTAGAPWGTAFRVGEHIVTYAMEDTARNQASCSFRIYVHSLSSASCDVQSPLNGHFSCYDANTGIAACILRCNDHLGYVPNPKYKGAYQYDCSKGRWSPKLPEYYTVDSCVEIVPKVITVTSEVNSRECVPAINEESAAFDLEYRAWKYQLNTKWHEVSEVTFSVMFESNCDISTDSGLKVRLTLKGVKRIISSETVARAELVRVSDRIKQAIVTGRLRLIRPISVQSHRYTRPVTPVVRVADLSAPDPLDDLVCQQGQERVEEECLICPAGTYRGDRGCTVCTSNTYQGRAGQVGCTPCSNGTSSQRASYSSLHCRSCMGKQCRESCVGEQCGKSKPVAAPSGGLSLMMIGIIVGVTCAVIVIILIVTVTCVIKQRKSAAKKAEQQRDMENNLSYDNPVYGETPVSMNQAAGNDQVRSKKAKVKDKGSVRSNASTASAMARAYPDMPEKEVEFTIDDKGKIDLLANKY